MPSLLRIIAVDNFYFVIAILYLDTCLTFWNIANWVVILALADSLTISSLFKKQESLLSGISESISEKRQQQQPPPYEDRPSHPLVPSTSYRATTSSPSPARAVPVTSAASLASASAASTVLSSSTTTITSTKTSFRSTTEAHLRKMVSGGL